MPRSRATTGGERPPAVAVALHDSLRPERLSPALLLHGALRAHLRRDRPGVVIELGPGSGCAASHPQLRAAAEAAGGTPRRRRRRLPTLWIGADDEGALEFARACVDALDGELR